MPAQATAKSVIASANRLIEVRHCCRRRSRIARDERPGVADADPPDEVDDVEAPADRDVDSPDADALAKRYVTAIEEDEERGRNETAKPRIHQRGVLSRTVAAILSVTVAGVWPGAMSGGRSSRADISPLVLLSCRAGVRVRQLREIRRPRPGVQLLEERVIERLLLQGRDLRGRVVDVAEDERLGRADLLAGRPDLAVPERAVLALGVDPGAVDPLDAVGALLHDAERPDGDVRVRESRQARERSCPR